MVLKSPLLSLFSCFCIFTTQLRWYRIFLRIGCCLSVLTCLKSCLSFLCNLNLINVGFKWYVAHAWRNSTSAWCFAIFYHSLIGDTSYHIQNELNDYFRKKLSTKLNLRIIHQPFTIGNLFKYKDNQELLHCAGIVYQLTCSCGRKSKRNLIFRINEH